MERKIDSWIKGRGAVSNPTSRFESTRTVYFNDGWEAPEEDTAPPLPTQIHPETIRSLISKNQSPDVPFNQSINPYKGCEHGCVYCFARPTHEYLGFSSGLDFETQIISKPNAAEVLRRELGKKSYKPEVLVLGANTDPYQPAENQLQISRQILEVLSQLNHPVTILTKSTGILRDLDLLTSMAERNLVHVYCSITTLNPQLAHLMEPRAATPAKRLRVINQLSAHGISVGTLASPMIPGLNDSELERILEESAINGAGCAGYILLRLPHQIKELFTSWLQEHFPDRASHILNLIRDTRAGKLYQNQFGTRMSGTGPYAQLLKQRFELAIKRYGLDPGPKPLSTELFVAPQPVTAKEKINRQLKLF